MSRRWIYEKLAVLQIKIFFYLAQFYSKPWLSRLLFKILSVLIFRSVTVSALMFTKDHLLPQRTESYNFLKPWMRIQNGLFFPRMTSSYYCRDPLFQQNTLCMSQICHLEVEQIIATTTHRRWCHSLRKKELEWDERGTRERRVVKGRGHAGAMWGRSWWCQVLER